MKIVFMGTPDFAVPCLEKLIENGNDILGVFTQPDKKVGRKQVITPSEVKKSALEHNLDVYQPTTLKDGEAFKIIEELAPEIIVVVAYGKILPKEIIDYPKYGCINVHASILPKYRGAAPIQWSVLNGDEETGVTIMQMDVGLDTGDIISVDKTKIDINETSEELFERLSVIGSNLLIKTLDNIKNNNVNLIKQDESKSNYASMIDRSLCEIDWNKSAFEIHNKIRGLQTWPVAITKYNGKNLKIHKSVLSDKKANGTGVVINNKNVLTVGCGDGKCIDILELQLEGKKRMDVKSFLLGNNINIGDILGE